jgi:rhodanese-related sulfurtransferase
MFFLANASMCLIALKRGVTPAEWFECSGQELWPGLSRQQNLFSASRVYIAASNFSRCAMNAISREELKQAIERGEVILVDARSAEKFHKSHLPAALNIPAGRAAELAPQLLPNKDACVVTYCVNFTWKLSEQLARELQALGYRNVRTYEEGRQDWMNAGLPLEGSAPYDPVPRFQPSTTEAEAEEKLKQVS